MFLGIYEGPLNTKYAIVDFTPFLDAWQYRVLSGELLHLEIVPMSMVRKIDDTYEPRHFPYGEETLTERLDIHARSNLDFEQTCSKITERADCKAWKPLQSKSEAEYQLVIKEIKGFESVSITIYATGALQIKCNPNQRNKILEWLEDAAELLPEQRRLVIFETSVRHMIWHTRTECVYPSDEVIEAVGKLEAGFSWYDFPIGWTYSYLQEDMCNPFQKYLPQFWPLEKFLVPHRKAKDKKRARKRPKQRTHKLE